MPVQKQQQLVSTSVALVKSTGTPKISGNCTSNLECPKRESEALTHDKVLEVIYGVRDNDHIVPKAEKQGVCFVVDAHERRVRIVGKDEIRKQVAILNLLN